MNAIIISTTPDRNQWLNNLLETIKGYDKYPVIILSDYTFEIGKIKQVIEHMDYDEFFFLQDSCEVKDTSIFDLVFETYKGKTVTFSPTMRSFLAKYRRDFIGKLNFPEAKNKLEAVDAEDWLYQQHFFDQTLVSLTDNFNKSDIFKKKFGRLNMILENEYLKKYKATWSREQIINQKEL